MKYVEPVRNWPLVPSETAILVVDVQQSEVEPELLRKHPEYGPALSERMIPALQRLLAAGRRLGVEVIYAVIESLTRDGRDRGLDHKLSGIHVPRGSPLAQVLPEVAPHDDEIVISKTSSGVFNSTNLDYVLRNLGIRNVIVAGLLTDQCVDMAVRDGADRGYYMICAADACASKTRERHEWALKAFGGYCLVQTVEEIEAALVTAAGSVPSVTDAPG